MGKEKSTIGKKLVFHFIACGLAVGLIDLSFSLFKEYHRLKTQTKEAVQNIGGKKLPLLGQAIFEEKQTKTTEIVKQLLAIEEVKHIEIKRKVRGDSFKTLLLLGQKPSSKIFSWE